MKFIITSIKIKLAIHIHVIHYGFFFFFFFFRIATPSNFFEHWHKKYFHYISTTWLLRVDSVKFFFFFTLPPGMIQTPAEEITRGGKISKWNVSPLDAVLWLTDLALTSQDSQFTALNREDEEWPNCQPTRFSAAIGRPGSGEPGRPFTALERVGRYFDYSSSSHGLLVHITR